MGEIHNAVRKTFVNHLRSASLTTCSRWALERRVMASPFPGKFSFKYHPWVREIHDSIAPHNVAMKAAQMGLTEICINRAFYVLDILKRDVLYVLPTAINASDFSKARFGLALKLSPYLKKMFTDTNTVNLKQAGPTTLYIRGSRGDSNLKSIPVSELILDEVDEMDQDQIWLAMERLSGQIEKNVWSISTPTTPNKGIHKLYQASTQEHFMFQCPLCSKWTELLFPECFEVIGESLNDPRVHESFTKCKECHGKLEHETKLDWLAEGKWIATNPNGTPDYRGFYINQLYSTTVTPGEFALGYLRGVGDEGAMSEFVKSKLGQPFVPDGGQITDTMIDNCVKNYSKEDSRPQSASSRLITMGVDQGDWLHVVVTEWFLDSFGRDINNIAKAKVIWHGKFNVAAENGWHPLDEMMRTWQVYHCVVDYDPNTNDARQFARRFPGYVTLCRRRKGLTLKEMAISEADDYRTQVVTVDKTSWLDIALGRFKVDGRITLPRDIGLEYRDHLKALLRTYTREKDTGHPVATYVNMGPDHYSHATCYAEIALPFAASYVKGVDITQFL